ncbi:MAG: hypothetical protein A2452_11195 [Candidatus Firestonebacteria bacterium RIFOXYC2_FULL_39_67]|nr:MAG: hypothetical protein A2452_11195 [Candidatus Firestonebacteria bacterium RIFOXYC2_FULL_39_67]
MNKSKYLIACILTLILFSGCQYKVSDAGSNNSDNLNVKYGLPSTNGKLIYRTGYALLHDKEKKEPLWVSYHLTANELNSPQIKRSNKFAPDPELLPGERAELNDYKNSGYDRGHMCPNADQSYSVITMKECFYLSNMCPQLHSLNAGKWGSLESKVRAFTKKQGEVLVVCGPVFDKVRSNINTIGDNKVWIPSGFFKVVIYNTEEGTKAIGYEMPHKNLTEELKKYIVKIRDIESETGLNFMNKLPQSEQDKLEMIVPVSPEMLN